MNSPRDHLATLRWRLANGRVHASNAWHRAAGRRIHGTRAGFSNWRNRRDIARGRRGQVRRGGDEIRSRLPGVRGRVNPATGQPHRRDAELGRGQDRTLARWRQSRIAEENRPPLPSRQARSAQPAVRERRTRSAR